MIKTTTKKMKKRHKKLKGKKTAVRVLSAATGQGRRAMLAAIRTRGTRDRLIH
jgi:hypothetical protein